MLTWPAIGLVFPNCVAKPKGERASYVGDMLLECKEISQLNLRRPFDRGYLINWDLEREIWSRAFKAVLGMSLGGKGGSSSSRGPAPANCGLIITEPMFNSDFPQLQAATERVVFEEFGFASLYVAPAPSFSLRRMGSLIPSLPAAAAGAGIVVDAGFSFTHVVPFFEGQPILQGVKRINVGGKLLTNYLKELVSYRALNMMDEPYLMECVKEALSFVSQDVVQDLKIAAKGSRSPYRREFVLPDGVSNFRGYVRDVAPAAQPSRTPGQQQGQPPQQPEAIQQVEQQQQQPGQQGQGQQMDGQQGGVQQEQQPAEQQQQQQQVQPEGEGQQQSAPPKPPTQKALAAAAAAGEQVLPLNNERFMVPEVLFHPSDIGLMQAGVAEAVLQAVQSVHASLHPLLYNNVILTGGMAGCPGFCERFDAELRPLVPSDYALGVHLPPNPALCAWEGMAAFGASPAYAKVAVTRAQWMAGQQGGGRHR
ncbi:actin family [Dunaliella salina]|uniref:Actin family n=1 Tax=Dunaliella salina TaxID=3046 RepID=A0ABQ7GX61_DUNSA|nr:actin family [Dunaliella salina]|eukprot:KAF5839191.1 actin family [Dunaliella salina]